jgi:hypothetical protein
MNKEKSGNPDRNASCKTLIKITTPMWQSKIGHSRHLTITEEVSAKHFSGFVKLAETFLYITYCEKYCRYYFYRHLGKYFTPISLCLIVCLLSLIHSNLIGIADSFLSFGSAHFVSHFVSSSLLYLNLRTSPWINVINQDLWSLFTHYVAQIISTLFTYLSSVVTRLGEFLPIWRLFTSGSFIWKWQK